MLHARDDYNVGIVDIRTNAGKFITSITFLGSGNPIPADEPVFLLRAQDPFAAEAVAMYANKLAAHARNDADLAFARLATRHSDLMAAWPHKKDYPDAPGVNAPANVVPVIDMTPEERRDESEPTPHDPLDVDPPEPPLPATPFPAPGGEEQTQP